MGLDLNFHEESCCASLQFITISGRQGSSTRKSDPCSFSERDCVPGRGSKPEFNNVSPSRATPSITIGHRKPRVHPLSERQEGLMDKFFSNAYRGDPGVPHSGPERFENIWIGSLGFSVSAWFHPYMWLLSNQFNWHDKAMLYEQYHWKKAMAKKQPYKFMWNQYMDKDARKSYYFNWPVYFP